MATYVVQMLYRDAGGEFWDDVSPAYETRRRAEQDMKTRGIWLIDANDSYSELRIHCYRKRPDRKPRPVVYPERRRLIEAPAVVAAPILRKSSMFQS